MKMKLFATLGLLAAACSTQAAVVAVNNLTVPVGTSSVAVPVLITPSSVGELIGAMNISFAAGQVGDAIPILNSGTEFDGTIWDNGGSFFGVAGTPSSHSVLSAIAMLNPLQVSANGSVVTYTLDTSSLPVGTYELDPDFQINMVGTSADTPLTFNNGVLNIQIPEPSTIALTATLALLGLGIACKRRRR
jgi:hypothetical protein